MMHKTKELITRKVFLSLLLLVMISCSDEASTSENERVRTVAVETLQATERPFSDRVRVSGVVEAVEDATISAENSGRIRSILDRGQQVEEGEVIAVMDSELSQAQYEAARTGYELAEDTFGRLERLHEDEIISTQDYLTAKAQRDQARAQLQQAEERLRNTEIRAPFDGRIEERFVQVGELTAPGAPVVRLVDADRLRVTAGIPERYSGQITEGSSVEMIFRALGTLPVESTVTFAGDVIDPGTRTFPVEMELSTMEGQIKPEMVVDLRIERTTLEGAIMVPRTALVRDEESIYLFVAVEEEGSEVADLREVHTGVTSGSLIQITSGLRSGDQVVVSGLRSLNTGDQLQIVDHHDASNWIEEAGNETY